MRLEQLEEAEKIIRLCTFVDTPFLDWLPRSPLLTQQDGAAIKQLLDDGQFYVLLDLKRAEQHGRRALDRLTQNTEYLRSSLYEHLHSLQVLIEKVEVEEALRRDRAALLSTLPPPETEQGDVASWISGRTTDPGSSS
jgi:hypothetical protein